MSLSITKQINYLTSVNKTKFINLFAKEIEGTKITNTNNRIRRIILKIPYCGTEMEWVVVLDSKLGRLPDLIPKIVNDVDNAYDTFDLDNFSSWDESKEESLYLLAMDIRNSYREYQIKKIRDFGIESIMFNLDTIAYRKDTVEVLLSASKGTVQFSMPVWDERDEDIVKGMVKSPSFLVHGHAIMLTMEFKIEECSSGINCPDSYGITFPDEMFLSQKAFALPLWTKEMSLMDFLPMIKEQISYAWNLRREFVCVLAHKYAVLEFDAVDYSTCHLLVRVGVSTSEGTDTNGGSGSNDNTGNDPKEYKVSRFNFNLLKSKLPQTEDKRPSPLPQGAAALPVSLVRIVQFILPHNFPDRPPSIIIHDNLSQQYWGLSPSYAYDPKWPADIMAEELYTYACNQIPYNI